MNSPCYRFSILVVISLISMHPCQSAPDIEPLSHFQPSNDLSEPEATLAPNPIPDTPQDPYCAGVAPVLSFNATGAPTSVAHCWQGYWRIPSSVAMSYSRYNIEGRLLVEGNFELLAGSSLSWRGFQSSADSRPDLPLSPDGEVRAYWLSHVNVTGHLTFSAESSIFIEISPAELEGIFGPSNSGGQIQSAIQYIAESENDPTGVTLLLNPTVNQDCREVSVSSTTGTNANGRFMLSLLISADDSACTPQNKKPNNIVKIVVPCVVIGVLLILGAVIFAAFKIPAFRKMVLPSRATQLD